jgi:hypothetical protein
MSLWKEEVRVWRECHAEEWEGIEEREREENEIGKRTEEERKEGEGQDEKTRNRVEDDS